MKVLKRLLIASVLLSMIMTLAACGGSTQNTANKFTTIYEFHGISPGAPMNPFNTNGNSFTSYDKMQLAWSANSATDLNKFYAGLAQKWSVNSDGTKVVLDLQPNAKWSNGRPVTAQDVKTSMAIAFTQGTAQSFYLGSVKSLSQKKVELDQIKGQSYNLFLRSLLQTTIVPNFQYSKLLPQNIWSVIDQSQYTGNDAAKQKQAKIAQNQLTKIGKKITTFAPKTDISAGPFILKRLNPGEAFMVKNPDFYAADKVKVDSISFRNYTGNQQIWNYLSSGQLDAAPFTSLPKNILKTILSKKGNKEVVTPSYVAASLAFDEGVYPYKNLNVRKAIAYAIDRNAVQKVAEPVVGKPSKYTDGIVDSVAEKWLTSEERSQLQSYNYNLTKAAALLKKAGFKKQNGKWIMPNGKPWTMTIYVVDGFSDWIQGAKVISTQLTNFGIDTKPTIVSSFSQYLADLADQKYPVSFWLDSLSTNMATAYGRLYGQPDGYNLIGGKLVHYPQSQHTKGNWLGLPKQLSLPNGEKVNPGELTNDFNILPLNKQKNNVEKLALATNANLPVIELWDYANVQFVNTTRFINYPTDQGLLDNQSGVWMANGYVHPVQTK